jgi:chromate transporter
MAMMATDFLGDPSAGRRSRMVDSDSKKKTGLKELAGIFLKLGVTGFGGPAAHIAMMEGEIVRRRRWITREYFLDLVGATNLIPGPNSTEMAIHIGYVRAGWSGLAVAGISFILPAVVITAAFAWAYVKFGSLPTIIPFFYGIKPAVLAVIFFAVWRLGRTAVKSWRLFVIGLFVTLASLLKMNEVAVLLLGGVIGMFWLRLPPRRGYPLLLEITAGMSTAIGTIFHNTGTSWGMVSRMAIGFSGPIGFSLLKLGLFFLKVGAVLFGSGYVLVAFLEGGLVHDYGWLTQQQLLDAIAIGQFTPGPVLSAATFIGYLILGVPGAVVSTVAIFLPSFFFVAALSPIVPRLRQSAWASAFLDAVNVGSVALMLAVVVKLSQTTLSGLPAWLIALAALGVSFQWKVNATWLILGGAAVGWVLSVFGYI